MGKSGVTLPSPPGDTSHTPEHSDRRTLQCLISRAVPQDELPSVIEAIVSNVNAPDIVKCLQPGDAQSFIDAIDEACHREILLLRNWRIDLPFFLLFLLVRCWTALIWHPESERNV